MRAKQADYLPSIRRPADRGLLCIAFAGALVLHALALLISFPHAPRPLPQAHHGRTPILLKRYVPPPPRIRQQPVAASTKKHTRKLPIPDPSPDLLEPVREPERELVPSPMLDDIEFLIGEPTPPGPVGPYASDEAAGRGEPVLAGVGGTSNPVRIESSYVQPQYPEIARSARVESRVILQAVIYVDGTVGEITTLSCDQPGFGFEAAAITAVSQWRYEPATHDGRPVCVYFTILVDFSLVLPTVETPRAGA